MLESNLSADTGGMTKGQNLLENGSAFLFSCPLLIPPKALNYGGSRGQSPLLKDQ